jgi:hypothetical protein
MTALRALHHWLSSHLGFAVDGALKVELAGQRHHGG